MTVNLGQITLSQLRFVCAVVDAGTFRSAAKRCEVSQPTLSVQIHKLEKALTVDIFDRRTQPIQLTNEGKEIVAQARSVLLSLEKFATLREGNSESLEGVLNLGIIPTLAPFLTPYLASGFVRKYPKISLTIHEASTVEIRLAIERQELDVGLLAGALDIPHVEERLLFAENYVCYFSVAHRLLQKEEIELSDLTDEGFLVCTDGDLLAYSSQHSSPSVNRSFGGIRLKTGCIGTIKHLADIEHGYAILPEFTVAQGLASADRLRLRRIVSRPQRAITMVNASFFNRRLLLSVLEEEIVSLFPRKSV